MAESKEEKNSKAGKMVVAAIDLGTTYSGYAFSFAHDFEKDPAKVAANTSWVAGSASLISSKTPTILLLNSRMEFVAFGYEAETCYSELAADNEHKSFYYFNRFTMLLYRSGKLRRDMKITDANGRKMAAIVVFSIAIGYLKRHLMDRLNQMTHGLRDDDIFWVLTVPVIWSDGSKQFMREAAEMAGINKKDLMIAFEPEAASFYCMHLKMYKQATFGMTESQEVAPFAKGTKYMVVDVGGDNIYTALYEVIGDGKLKALYYGSKCACGGNRVDAAFENFLRKIVGNEVLDTFFYEEKEAWVDLFREFETKKRRVKESGKETIKIPISLSDMYRKINSKTLKEAVSNDKSLAGVVAFASDKLRVDVGLFRSWFDETCNNTVKHMRELFKQKSSEGTRTILLVGGVSESPILQDVIRKNFPDKRVIIPEEAALVVLKGAVIFGHDPMTIVSRIAKCSYGIRVYRVFQDGVHPENKKVNVGGRAKCKDVFALHVKKGQELVGGQAQSKQRYRPLEADQVSLVFDIYTSEDEDPQFVTDVGCTYIGQLEVEVPDLSGGKKRGVWVQMIFGGTELVVEAWDEKSKELTRAKFDFLQSSHISENND